MFNINQQWKKWMAICCSHGHLANEYALEKVLNFKNSYRPDVRFHLGDFVDMAAFMTSAPGSKNESAPIGPDLCRGLTFIREYAPTDVANGNHEYRLWELADHHNQLIARAAQSVIEEIRGTMNDIGAEYMESYNILDSWFTLADTKFMHGWMYGQNAIRDHAAHFGKCVFGHLHKTGISSGQRCDSPRAYCVGTLADIPAMHYALRRRATAEWNHGFAWGEYSDKECHINLSECPRGEAINWRLPL